MSIATLVVDDVRLVPLYLFHTVDAFVAQMGAFVREALREGLAGWEVTDCRVTMVDCGYASPVTSLADFRRHRRVQRQVRQRVTGSERENREDHHRNEDQRGNRRYQTAYNVSTHLAFSLPPISRLPTIELSTR